MKNVKGLLLSLLFLNQGSCFAGTAKTGNTILNNLRADLGVSAKTNRNIYDILFVDLDTIKVNEIKEILGNPEEMLNFEKDENDLNKPWILSVKAPTLVNYNCYTIADDAVELAELRKAWLASSNVGKAANGQVFRDAYISILKIVSSDINAVKVLVGSKVTSLDEVVHNSSQTEMKVAYSKFGAIKGLRKEILKNIDTSKQKIFKNF